VFAGELDPVLHLITLTDISYLSYSSVDTVSQYRIGQKMLSSVFLTVPVYFILLILVFPPISANIRF
jgi:hypothetical protein